MKKKGFLALFIAVICLLSVACGKEKKEEKKKEEIGVKTLTCSIDEDDQEAKMVISIDFDKKEVTKAYLSMIVPKEIYTSFGIADDKIEETLCEEDKDDYKSCVIDISGNNVKAEIEYDPAKYKEELVEEYKEINEGILDSLKKQALEEGYTCTIE